MQAILRDISGQTIEARLRSYTSQSRYVYSQFYNIIKMSFDAAKIYPFSNKGLKNLALNPDYVRGLYKAGSTTAFLQEAIRKSYIYSKIQANTSITSSIHKLYGIREEHHLLLTLVTKILGVLQFQEDQLIPVPVLAPALALVPAVLHQLYYTIPSIDVFQFLQAQLNKYCLLFEHVLMSTNKAHLLPELVIMALVLQVLQSSYSSIGQPALEPILYKDI